MKKLYVLLTLGMLACGMTACGNSSDEAVSSDEQSQTTESQTQETIPAEEDTSAAETGEQDNGMDEAAGWSEEMEGIRQAVMDVLGDQYWPDTQMDSEILEMLCAIAPDMYDDYMAEMPMISTNVDTLLIIKAKDDKVESVEEALNAYRDAQINNTMQYPTNLGKIQASRVAKYGNYVCFVQLGGDNLADENMTEEQSLVECQAQNDAALAAIEAKVSQE